jgi:hypothetical protein
MAHLFGIATALLLIGGGAWANVYVGSLSQDKGSWLSHSN